MKKYHFIFNYILLLVPSFLLISLLWSFSVDGKLYYCSDWFPFFDFFPPFVHGPQYGDYFIVNKFFVWTVWIILLIIMFSIPLMVMSINKAKKISLLKKILIVGGLVCIIVLGTSFYIIHTTVLTKYVPSVSKTVFNLGNFSLSLDQSTLAKDSDPFYTQVHNTEILPKTDDTTDCVHVSGLYFAYLEKPVPPKQTVYSKPHLYIESWNMDTLTFEDNQWKSKAEIAINQLNNLNAYTDEQKLQQIFVNPSYDADDFAVADPRNFPNLSPWRGFYTCSGSYSIPFLIKKIPTDKFDAVYFAEVSEGNGDTYSYPQRTLVVRKNNAWVILKDDQKQFQEEKDGSIHSWPGCPTGTLSKQELACAMRVWTKQYRNKIENQQWIENMLQVLSYTNAQNSVSYPPTPEKVLEKLYATQLDCANRYDVHGTPVSFQKCMEQTSMFNENNQKISVSCGKQNIPTYDEIKIDSVKIHEDQATTVVHTIWADGKDTPADIALKRINNQWKVAEITCTDK